MPINTALPDLQSLVHFNFGNSPQFWLNLQAQYDLRQAYEENQEVYSQIPLAQVARLT